LAGQDSHPLDDKRSFMVASQPPFPFDQPCLVAPVSLSWHTGGRSRDALILRCARKAQATTLLILDQRDFSRLDPGDTAHGATSRSLHKEDHYYPLARLTLPRSSRRK
jgi:hypothetical protein